MAGGQLTSYTSASVVILRSCSSHLSNVALNLDLIRPGDWMEQELMDQARDHLNELIKIVEGLVSHRDGNKGDTRI